MSTSQTEGYGQQAKRSCYSRLDKAYTYNCPCKNSSYPGIGGGINCLCQKGLPPSDNNTNKVWPMATPDSFRGWKL